MEFSNVSFWHNRDLQPRAFLGPNTAGLPTAGPERWLDELTPGVTLKPERNRHTLNRARAPSPDGHESPDLLY